MLHCYRDEFSLREGIPRDKRRKHLLTAKDERMINLCARKRGLLLRSHQCFHKKNSMAVSFYRGDDSVRSQIKRAGILFKNEQERYYQPGRKFASTMRTRKT